MQAGDIEKKVLAFCLDPSKKGNMEQTATIMRYFKDMRGIVEELLLHNSYLTGKLEQCTGSVKDTQILSAVNKSQQVSKRLETAVKKTAKAEPKQPTYAEKVRVTNTRIGQLVVKPPRNVIIIRPEDKEGKIKTSEEAKEGSSRW